MLPFIAHSAVGPTVLQVGIDPDYPTVTEAVGDAESGDVIEIHGPGPYVEDAVDVHDLDLTFTGVGDPVLRAESANFGFFRLRGTSVVDISGVHLVGDDANRAFIVSDTAVVTLSDSTVADTRADGSGGAAVVDGEARLTLLRVDFARSASTASGGFVYAIGGGAVVAEDCTFTDAVADAGGGAFYCDLIGGCSFTDCTFSLNRGSHGGAVMSRSTLEVVGSRFCTNAATDLGGALFFYDGPAQVERSVFGRNIADIGGSIAASQDLTVAHSDFLENGATDVGAAIAQIQGELRADHSLFAGHSAADTVIDVSGEATAILDYTLFDETIPATSGNPGDHVVLADPLLTYWDPDDCENAILTLEPGSPAIDAGDPALPDADGSPADIGAFGPACVEATEIPANGVDEDCDGFELCFQDTDGDGFGEAGVTVPSPDLECPSANDRCPGFDDLADDDVDLVPDGCDACPGGDDRADADLDGLADACDPAPTVPDASRRAAQQPAAVGPPAAGCACSTSTGGVPFYALALLVFAQRLRRFGSRGCGSS